MEKTSLSELVLLGGISYKVITLINYKSSGRVATSLSGHDRDFKSHLPDASSVN